MLPDSDPIGALADLMRSVGLPMSYSNHTLLIELLALLDHIPLVIILELFARVRKKILVDLGRQRPWWAASRRLLVRWKLEANEVAFWMKEIVHTQRPTRSRFGFECAEELKSELANSHHF